MNSTRRFTVMIPIKLYKELEKIAERRFCTISALIVEALVEFIAKQIVK